MITESTRFLVLKTIYVQLKISKYFRLLFIISLLFSAMLILPIDGIIIEIIQNVALIALNICLFFIVIAILTAVHEHGHLSACRKLGYKASLRPQRLGDVWVTYPDDETMNEDEHYQIGIGPFTRVIDYLLPPIFFLLWILMTINLPFIPAIFMWVMSALFAVFFIADYCAYATVKFKLKSGMITKIAWFFTSRDDLEGILEYHNKI